MIKAHRRGSSRPFKLVEAHRIANKSSVDEIGSYSRLRQLPPHSRYLGNKIGDFQDKVDRIGAGGDAESILNHAVLRTMACHENELPAFVRNVMKNGVLPNYPYGTAFMIRMPEVVLQTRYAAVRVLLAAEEDKSLYIQKPEEFRGFRSASGLTMDINSGLLCYFAPLLASLAPYVWGVHGTRAGGAIIYSLGAPLPGLSQTSRDLIRQFEHSDSNGSTIQAPSSGGAYEMAIVWWVERLNELFNEVTDPYNFADYDSGLWNIRRHFEHLLNVGQIFSSVQALATVTGNDVAGRSLLYDVLDALGDGLKLLSFDSMVRYATAQKTLDELRVKLPVDVASVLLPRCESAVAALKRVQDGFFLPSRLSGDLIRYPSGKRVKESLHSKEDAAAAYLREMRNAKHGFSGNNDAGRLRADALIASHDGYLPAHLPDLAYLYLLRLMASPELVRRRV
ncbi:hypothetical protein AB0425_18720 [Actinosynnema sp. NPDC051121]